MFWRILRSLLIAGCLSMLAGQTPPLQSGNEVLRRYLAHTAEQRSRMSDVSQEINIDAKIPELEKHGQLRALRRISKLGKVTYDTLSLIGDNMVKKYVIANYVDADIKASGESDDSMAINQDNYTFRFDHVEGEGDWVLYLYELKPKKKRQGMFEGWMWIESQSALPVREAGHLVKNPSVYLKRIDFIRDYRLRDGIAETMRIETTIRSRLLIGPANLEIHFGEMDGEDLPKKFTAWTHPPG